MQFENPFVAVDQALVLPVALVVAMDAELAQDERLAGDVVSELDDVVERRGAADRARVTPDDRVSA